eukprot:TRINITY_DN41345_c0_g1_i1.p1 TRINITY_DN41345_c0_g1~~TRINITY_DN41345_c0_g1_i1.p1  ORF type:complete len:982 (+),score=142.91 TRINITY_DN41345_c0_g1_i1:174-3119(+)
MPREMQSSVFSWIDSSKRSVAVEEPAKDARTRVSHILKQTNDFKHHTRTDVDEVVEDHGVPASAVLDYLSSEVAAMESCRGLPFTLFLLLVYALLVHAYLHVGEVKSVEESVIGQIEAAEFGIAGDMEFKNFHDIHDARDFWSWIGIGVVPKFFDDPNESGVIGSYNRMAYGVRMSQERNERNNGECTTNTQLADVYDAPCIAGGDRYYNLQPRQSVKLERGDGLVVFLYVHEKADDMHRRLARMEKEDWIDNRTRKVEVAFAVYNGELDVHTVVMCNFYFPVSGALWKRLAALSVFNIGHVNIWLYVYDVAFIGCLLKMLLTEAKQISKVLSLHGPKGLVREYFSISNFIDWLSVLSGLSLIVLCVFANSKVLMINKALKDLSDVDKEKDMRLYDEKGLQYWDALGSCASYLHYFYLVLAAYPIVIAMQLFKAFQSQRRLALVTRSLQVSAVDLVHFMIIFVPVVLLFAVSGVILFGRALRSFTTIAQAVNTCFRLIHGDIDWHELKSVGRGIAATWWITFLISVVIVLTSMLIAIVMDAYAGEKLKTAEAAPIWTEVARLWKLWRYHRANGIDFPTMIHSIEEWVQEENDREMPKVSVFDDDHDKGAENEDQEVEVMPPRLLDRTIMKELFSDIGANDRKDILKKAAKRWYEVNQDSISLDRIQDLIGNSRVRARMCERIRKDVKQEQRTSQIILHEMDETYEKCTEMISVARQNLKSLSPQNDDTPLPEAWLLHKPAPRATTGDVVVGDTVDSDARLLAHDDPMASQGRSMGDAQPPLATDMERGLHLDALEQELDLGRKTVDEAVQAVDELHQRLLRSKSDRRQAFEKYQQLSQRAVLLKRENRAQKERVQQQRIRLKVMTSERNEYFERVRELVEANAELDLKLRLAEAEGDGASPAVMSRKFVSRSPEHVDSGSLQPTRNGAEVGRGDGDGFGGGRSQSPHDRRDRVGESHLRERDGERSIDRRRRRSPGDYRSS